MLSLRPSRRPLTLCLALLALPAAGPGSLCAQDTIPGSGGQSGEGTQGTGESRLLPASPFRSLLERGDVPTTFDGGAGARRFQGFPTIAPPDFGAYPGGALAPPFLRAGELGPTYIGVEQRSPNRWPAWLGVEGDGFLPTLAILVHSSDYVWVREADESAFVPLAPYQRFLVVKEGSEVDLRGDGQFSVRLHGGADARISGAAHLTLRKLDDTGATLDFGSLTRLLLSTAQKPVRVEFGPRLGVESTDGKLRFELDEDGAISCWNEFGADATIVLGGERTTFARGHRVRLLTGAAHNGIATELGSDGDIKLAQDGRVMRASGALRGGTVVWNGSRIRVIGGGVLRIDPLAGKEFPASPSNLP